MSAPKRIQLRRTKGWRKPEGAIVVARPSKWGNPFRVGATITTGFAGVSVVVDADLAVRQYRRWLTGTHPAVDAAVVRNSLDELRGHDLACWCPLDQPCHADVLLDLANEATR